VKTTDADTSKHKSIHSSVTWQGPPHIACLRCIVRSTGSSIHTRSTTAAAGELAVADSARATPHRPHCGGGAGGHPHGGPDDEQPQDFTADGFWLRAVPGSVLCTGRGWFGWVGRGGNRKAGAATHLKYASEGYSLLAPRAAS